MDNILPTRVVVQIPTSSHQHFNQGKNPPHTIPLEIYIYIHVSRTVKGEYLSIDLGRSKEESKEEHDKLHHCHSQTRACFDTIQSLNATKNKSENHLLDLCQLTMLFQVSIIYQNNFNSIQPSVYSFPISVS